MEDQDHASARTTHQRVMTIAIIVAMGRNRAIGYRNRLPWSIPEDMAHFKQLTMGHTIIMGRHTFYSLPHGALPGRRNMVVSRTVESIPGCEVFPSLESALEACNAPSGHSVGDAQGASADNTVFVIGGASVGHPSHKGRRQPGQRRRLLPRDRPKPMDRNKKGEAHWLLLHYVSF